MKLKVNEKNIDYAAEVLREWSFVGEGTGCYQNFELRDGFIPIDKDGHLAFRIKAAMADELYFEENDVVLHAYYHPKENIYIAWFWDGDGSLLIGYDGKWMLNSDCKCSYGWEFVD